MGKNTLNIDLDFLKDITNTYYNLENEDFERQLNEPEPYKNQRPISKACMGRHIKELLEVSLWASLMTEERRQHRFAVVYTPRENISDHLVFAEPLPFTPETLAKLSPALESTGTIAVWSKENNEDELEVWGTTPPLLSGGVGILITVIAPAQLLVWLRMYEIKARVTGVKSEWVEDGLFHNFFDKIWPKRSSDNFLVEAERKLYLKKIALSMRAHSHGGTLLIIPNNQLKWHPLIEQGQYKLATPYQRFKETLEKRDEKLRQFALSKTEAARSMEQTPEVLSSIAQLTAVDGATLIQADFEVLGFGVKIKMQPTEPAFFSLAEQFETKKFDPVPFNKMPGGMRHKSAANFVFNYQGAVAIVASEDGRISLFKKRDKESIYLVRDLEFLWL